MKKFNHEHVQRVRRLANFLDTRFSVWGFRFGWDAIVGLIPVVGDGLASIPSFYILLQGFRLKLPTAVIYRMLGNIAVEYFVGFVPVVGDAFDVFWKSNQRNARLFEVAMQNPKKAKRKSQFYGVFVALTIGTIFISLVALPFFLAFQLFQMF